MKNLFFFFLATLIAGTLFTSCKKDAEDTQPLTSYFNTTLDGEAFETRDIYSYAADFDSHINVYGVRDLDGDEAIYIAIPKDVEVGTYTFTENSDGAFALVSQGETGYVTFLEGGEGQVIVEEFDGTNLKGTFQFKAVNYDDFNDTIIATEGTFDVDIRL